MDPLAWIVLLVGTVLLIALWAGLIVPIRELRRAAHRLAGGDRRPLILPEMPPLLRGFASDLGRLAERLSDQHDMIEKEEFSFSVIMESMAEGVVITGPDLRIRYVNKAAEAMFNLSGRVAGLLLPEVFLGHELVSVTQRVASTGEIQRGEFSQTIPGHRERRHLVVTAASLGTGGNPGGDGFLLVLHDVTRLRELESVRREFVANVTHEFRTPLSIINGYLETLEEGGVGREMMRKSLAVMRRHADRLNRLLDDLLTISRMEEKGASLEKAPTDVGAMLTALVEHYDSEIRQRDVTLSLEIASGLPEVGADAYRLEQAFSNLLVNALQHGSPADRGGGLVRITAALEGPEIAVRFHDNGPGVPIKDQEHLFERFYRVGGDRARQTGGTGLGLSIVKNVARAHGGRVGLESRPGEGSTFSIFLPAGP